MKKIKRIKKAKWIFFVFCLLVGLSGMAREQIKFNGETYILKERRATSVVKDGYRNVYLRSNETMATWSKMIVIQTYPHIQDPNQAALYMKNSYPVISANGKTGIINFKGGAILPLVLLNPHKGKPVYEHNVIRFDVDKESGIISFQYTERHPVRNVRQARKELETIEKSRGYLIEKVKRVTMPKIIKEE